MKLRPHHALPEDQEALLNRARRLEWWTLLVLVGTATLMYLTMGNSQAMKTAWIEDMLSMVPPLAFLVASRFAHRPPDRTYVNGRDRAYDIAFLISAVALSGVGLALVIDALLALVQREHPAIGGVEILGYYLWQGWVMMGALLLATLGPLVIARRKLALSRQLPLKPLRTDADMSKADWMTAAAGIAGVAGIGMGWWWADAAAALVIAGSIVRDGLRNLRHAVRDMHDAWPETVGRGSHDPLVERVRKAVLALDWVQACQLRLHEEGMRLSGVVFVTPVDQRNLAARLVEARETACAVHWRLDSIVVTLDDDGG